MDITEMVIDDYDQVISLWRRVEGVGLHDDCDSEDGISVYLRHNPGLSVVVRQDSGRIVGAVMCGHDGRRGYLHHLAVDPAYRKTGIGRALVNRVLTALRAKGIRKCHIFIFADNLTGQSFWRRIGWAQRADLVMMSRPTDAGKDA